MGAIFIDFLLLLPMEEVISDLTRVDNLVVTDV